MISCQKCMSYQARRDFLNALVAHITYELMQTHPIDRDGLVKELPKAIESAVKRQEEKEAE